VLYEWHLAATQSSVDIFEALLNLRPFVLQRGAQSGELLQCIHLFRHERHLVRHSGHSFNPNQLGQRLCLRNILEDPPTPE
jgi:hypothetical protein